MSDIDLNSPEVKEAIKAAVQEATEGLDGKNRELLAEVKKLKKETGIKPEDIDRLEAENEQLKLDLAKVNKDLKTANTNAEKVAAQLQSESAYAQKLLVDNGLSAALHEAGVREPAYLKAAKAMLKDQVKVEVNGDDRIAKIGDKSLKDFTKEWAAGDEGKFYVSAPGNSGGGANGGGSKGGAKTMTRAAFDALGQFEKASAMKDGVSITD